MLTPTLNVNFTFSGDLHLAVQQLTSVFIITSRVFLEDKTQSSVLKVVGSCYGMFLRIIIAYVLL